MEDRNPGDHRVASPRSGSTRAEDRIRKERLLELATFLRDCRSRVRPDPPPEGHKRRRRVDGLTREEVAQRAGISTDWYVRIEQGRDVHPSLDSLRGIAAALRMSAAEQRHLMTLATGGPTEPIGPPSDALSLQRVAEQMTHAPALVLDRRWFVIGQNRAARELWGDWVDEPSPHNNLLYRFFTDTLFVDHLEDWERHAQLAIRQYRAVFARELRDRGVRDLVSDLCDRSGAFSAWWNGADVAGRDNGRKVFRLHGGERRAFDYTMLRHSESDVFELIVFVPAPLGEPGKTA